MLFSSDLRVINLVMALYLTVFQFNRWFSFANSIFCLLNSVIYHFILHHRYPCFIQEKRQPTPAELRALEAEKRAQMRQARMKALEEDAMKAQVVIAQVKALSSSSLEGSSVSDTDRPSENSLFS